METDLGSRFAEAEFLRGRVVDAHQTVTVHKIMSNKFGFFLSGK